MEVSFIVEETGVPGENPPTCRKSWTYFITYCCIKYTSPWTGFELTTLVVIANDYIGSCKSNYHKITATMAPNRFGEMCYFNKGNYIHFIFILNVSFSKCLNWNVKPGIIFVFFMFLVICKNANVKDLMSYIFLYPETYIFLLTTKLRNQLHVTMDIKMGINLGIFCLLPLYQAISFCASGLLNHENSFEVFKLMKPYHENICIFCCYVQICKQTFPLMCYSNGADF